MILDLIGCSEELIMVVATFALQGEAVHWWEATVRLLRKGLSVRPITWKAFVDAFIRSIFKGVWLTR